MSGRRPIRRFVVLDAYRYVAATGVFLFHVNITNNGLHLPGIGSYGLFVDMFFILSGFVIFFTYRDRIRDARAYRTFVVKRLARVYPLHILTLVAFAAIGAWRGDGPSASAFPEQFALNALLVQAWGVTNQLSFNAPAWSISGEFACYLLFPLLAAAATRLPLLPAFAGVGLLYVAGAHGGLPFWSSAQAQMYNATFDFGLLRALIGFINGVLLCRLFAALAPHRACLPLGCAAMAVAVLLMNVWAKPDVIILLLAIGIVLTALGEAAVRVPPRAAAVLEWFGNTSYAVYMLHWALVSWVVDPLIARVHPPLGPLALGLLAATVGLTLVSHFVYTGIEAPARRAITQRFAPSQKARVAAAVGD